MIYEFSSVLLEDRARYLPVGPLTLAPRVTLSPEFGSSYLYPLRTIPGLGGMDTHSYEI